MQLRDSRLKSISISFRFYMKHEYICRFFSILRLAENKFQIIFSIQTKNQPDKIRICFLFHMIPWQQFSSLNTLGLSLQTMLQTRIDRQKYSLSR